MQSAREDTLVRLVVSPDGILVPDVAARLPGRGMWVSADGPALDAAVKSGQLAKAASRSLKAAVPRTAVADDLVSQIERLLERRCLDRLGLEQRAGNLVTGFDKIKAALTKKGSGKPALLVTATDGAEDGRRKMRAAVGRTVPEVVLFDREALSGALGRDNVVHVLLMKSGGTEKLLADIARLLGLRGQDPLTCEAPADGRGQGTKNSMTDEKKLTLSGRGTLGVTKGVETGQSSSKLQPRAQQGSCCGTQEEARSDKGRQA